MNTQITAAIAAKTAAEAEIAELDKKINRLSTAAQKSSPAVASLNALRDDHKRAIEAYNGDGDLPQIDLAQSDRLRREIEAFEDTKVSANAAIVSLQQAKQKAIAIRDSADRYAKVEAFKHVLQTEGSRLVDEMIVARQTLADLDATRNAFRNSILAQANILDERSLFAAVEASNVKFEPISGKVDLAAINAKLDAILNPTKAA